MNAVKMHTGYHFLIPFDLAKAFAQTLPNHFNLSAALKIFFLLKLKIIFIFAFWEFHSKEYFSKNASEWVTAKTCSRNLWGALTLSQPQNFIITFILN